MEKEKYDADECQDRKLIADKLHTKKALYKKAKRESVGIIQSQIHQSRLYLLEGHTTAQAIWIAIKAEFNITCASEIGAIAARVMSKLFLEFSSIEEYCQAYQEAYDKIASRFANKNGYQYQDKAFNVFL